MILKRDIKGRIVGEGRRPFSCIQCNSIFEAYSSEKKKFCSHNCYSQSLNLGFTKLEMVERKRNYYKNKCLCGKLKLKTAQHCFQCSVPLKTGELSPHFKGGYELHLKLNRERSTKLKIMGGHTPQEWYDLKVKFNSMCLCCKQQEPFIKLTRDHIIPISRGGTDDIGNIQPLCLSCNVRKYTKVINFIELHEQNKAETLL